MRHRLVVQLAVGGARASARPRGVKGALLGGWQINGITQLQSGFPFNVNTNAAYPTGDYNGDGVEQRPAEPAGVRSRLPADTSQDAYINGLFVAARLPRVPDGRSGRCRATPIAAPG